MFRFKDFFSAGNYSPIEDPESESGQESEVILTRLKSLYLYFNLTRWGCFTLLLKLLTYCSQNGVCTLPVSSIMYCTSLHINWIVASFNKDYLDEAGVNLINEKVPMVRIKAETALTGYTTVDTPYLRIHFLDETNVNLYHIGISRNLDYRNNFSRSRRYSYIVYPL